MKISCPHENIDETATHALIKQCVTSTMKNENAFVILSENDLTYIQALSVPEGLIVQFQEGSLSKHFEFEIYMSRPKTIEMMNRYLERDPNWKSNFVYHKVNVQGFFGWTGYSIGRLLGLIVFMPLKIFNLFRLKN